MCPFLANFSCIHMFCLERRCSYGILEESWIDITEYEENERNYSPLIYLLKTDKECIERPTMTEVFEDKVFKSWLNTKIKMHIPTFVIAFVFRLFFCIIFLQFDDIFIHLEDTKLMQNRNISDLQTTCHVQYFIESGMTPVYQYLFPEKLIIIYAALLLAICMVGLVFVTIEIVGSLIAKFSHTIQTSYPHREKNMYLYYWFHIVCEANLFLSILVFVCLRLSRLYLGTELPNIVDDLLYLMIFYNMIIFLIQLSQLLPVVGTFPIIMQRMLGDLSSFMLFLIIYMFPFGGTMLHIVGRGKTVCPAGFGNAMEVLYSTILMLVNMMGIRELSSEEESSTDVYSLYFTHAAFIFMEAILMLNLLIALFSHSVAKIMEHKNVIINLQRLYIVVVFEWKLNPILGCLFKFMRRKCFKHRDGKLYISSVSVKDYY